MLISGQYYRTASIRNQDTLNHGSRGDVLTDRANTSLADDGDRIGSEWIKDSSRAVDRDIQKGAIRQVHRTGLHLDGQQGKRRIIGINLI